MYVSLCSTGPSVSPYCTIWMDFGGHLGNTCKNGDALCLKPWQNHGIQYLSTILIMDSQPTERHGLASAQSVGVSQCDLHFPNLVQPAACTKGPPEQ